MKSFIGIAALLGLLCYLALNMAAKFNAPINPFARIVECATDTECHDRNPGVCAPSQAYCF